MTDRQREPIKPDESTLFQHERTERAARAWRRYRRLMAWMVAASIVAVAGAIAWLGRGGGAVPVQMLVAAVAGVGLAVLLASALMGLVLIDAVGVGDAAEDGSER